MRAEYIFALLSSLVATTSPFAAAHAECWAPLAVQVLGSGGPDATDARASAGYVLWLGGKARLLVDAGGGVFLRFGEAKAKFESLDAIAITHLHADHVVDLVALLKSGVFSDRKLPLPIIGPSGGGDFPGMSEFMMTQFDPKHGAYRYLSGYLDGSNGLVRTPVTEVQTQPAIANTVFENSRFKLTAIGVTHGPVPALALSKQEVSASPSPRTLYVGELDVRRKIAGAKHRTIGPLLATRHPGHGLVNEYSS